MEYGMLLIQGFQFHFNIVQLQTFEANAKHKNE